MSNNIRDKRLAPLMYRIRSRCVAALGVMVNTDSCAYFTSSDVAFKLLQTACIDPKSIPQDDLERFTVGVSGALAASCSRVTDNVRRTPNRITPKLSGGRAAYGYRIGLSLGSELITTETLQQSKVNTESYELVRKNKTSTSELIVAMMTFRELSMLELCIQARKEQLYFEMETKYLDAQSCSPSCADESLDG